MKWSQLKKRIEDTFAQSVRGRVEVWTTRYRKSHDEEGEAWITLDKKQVHSMGTLTYWIEASREAERLRKERTCTDSKGEGQFEKHWDAYHEVLQTIEDKGILPLWDVNAALFDYLNMSIAEILSSDHPIIRAFGMLDKRLGKRRLKALDVSNEHPLIKILHGFRCSSEGIEIAPKQEP